MLTLLASIGLLAVSSWFLSASALAGLSLAAARNFDIHTPSAAVRGFAVLRTAGRYAERVISHEATLRLLASLRVWFYQLIEPRQISLLGAAAIFFPASSPISIPLIVCLSGCFRRPWSLSR
jgi:ABC-type transport system involved in cytochrome bd biosynthesis fused ATPase/permease subunit